MSEIHLNFQKKESEDNGQDSDDGSTAGSKLRKIQSHLKAVIT